MTTLSLEASKKIFELIGEYETEKIFHSIYIDRFIVIVRAGTLSRGDIPIPTFSELIRVLERFWEKKRWIVDETDNDLCLDIARMAILYADAPTEPEGMKAVEDYLMKLL